MATFLAPLLIATPFLYWQLHIVCPQQSNFIIKYTRQCISLYAELTSRFQYNILYISLNKNILAE